MRAFEARWGCLKGSSNMRKTGANSRKIGEPEGVKAVSSVTSISNPNGNRWAVASVL